MDFNEGGSSPWFNTKGRSTVAGLTSTPENADLFTELARDGTIGALVTYLDTEQPSVSTIALICYIVLGMVLLELFVLLPLSALGLRRYTGGVGLIPWLFCELVLLACAGVQLVCLLSMISTWYGMNDGLVTKWPEAYTWTFGLLRNYTKLTVQLLKEAKDPTPDIDNALTLTTSGINWLQGNMSAWDNNFGAYAALQHMVTGPMSLLQMGALGLALAVAVAAALLACGAWNRRSRNLEKGGKSPVFVGFVLLAGAVLLLTHLGVALPMIARLLPVCVLADTYFCGPYRAGSYGILNDGVARVWPLAHRPEPFCRLVPSALLAKCSTKDTTPIKSLAECPKKDAKKKALAFAHDAVANQVLLLQPPPPQPPPPQPPPPQPPQPPQPAPDTPAAPKGKKPIGDCFYPYKIIDTDMTAACPLFTDDLVGHWMAIVLSVGFGVLSSLAAGAIAVIFLAIGDSRRSTTITKKIVRKRRVKKRKKKKPKKAHPAATTTTTSASTTTAASPSSPTRARRGASSGPRPYDGPTKTKAPSPSSSATAPSATYASGRRRVTSALRPFPEAPTPLSANVTPDGDDGASCSAHANHLACRTSHSRRFDDPCSHGRILRRQPAVGHVLQQRGRLRHQLRDAGIRAGSANGTLSVAARWSLDNGVDANAFGVRVHGATVVGFVPFQEHVADGRRDGRPAVRDARNCGQRVTSAGRRGGPTACGARSIRKRSGASGQEVDSGGASEELALPRRHGGGRVRVFWNKEPFNATTLPKLEKRA
ncbi:hypothetical protein V5799_005910 [Amblyomma americanum]|uniref:Uncharacterized protein n=1 Tax=Amblyomma americanum TaxID=6943 RepID=A0AAQ4DXW5_AMBAM